MVIDILASIFAGFAILLSIIGLLSAKQSNKLSKEAIEISKKSSHFQTRPWIDIKVTKIKESERYYEIVREENRICWKLKITLENIGSSPAINIRYPNIINIKDCETINQSKLILLDNIVLGQGQKYQYDITLSGEVMADKNIDQMHDGYLKRDKGLFFTFLVYYNGLFEQDVEYKSKSVFSISASSVSILNGSEMV